MTKTIPDFITKLTKAADVHNVMDNAKAKGRNDVYWAAFRHLCDLEGRSYNDVLEQDFYKMLAAYESLLTEKHGRKTKASRTRPKIDRHGFQKCLVDWVSAKKATPGFLLLIENKMVQYTAEAVVAKHS